MYGQGIEHTLDSTAQYPLTIICTMQKAQSEQRGKAGSDNSTPNQKNLLRILEQAETSLPK